jgi:hypothetical protein
VFVDQKDDPSLAPHLVRSRQTPSSSFDNSRICGPARWDRAGSEHPR